MSKQSSLKWKDEFSIGIALLDRQHEVVFTSLLDIENALQKRDPWNIVQWFLNELENSLATHLIAEETLLEVFGYPDLASHRIEHGELRKALHELVQRIQASRSTESLVPFFEQWFIQHVLTHDRKFVPFMKPFLKASTAMAA